MRLIYSALTTASLLLTASPSFGLSLDEVLDIGLGLDLKSSTFVTDAIASIGIVSVIPIIIGMGTALKTSGKKLKSILFFSLLLPMAVIACLAITGFILGWTASLSSAIAFNLSLIIGSVPFIGIASRK